MAAVLQHYGDGSRAGGVTHFVLLDGAMILLFRNGAAYLYTDDHTGQEHLRRMRELAKQGRGLSTYVSRHVSRRFTQKLTALRVADLRREIDCKP